MNLQSGHKLRVTKPNLFWGLALFICLMTAACTATEKDPEVITEDDRPNILRLVLEEH